MADDEILVDYEEEIVIKAEAAEKQSDDQSEKIKEAVLPTANANDSSRDGAKTVLESGSRGSEKRHADGSSNRGVFLPEKRREKRPRIQNMFDVTSMTYEQYVEKHYTLLYEEWFANNAYPHPHFFPMVPPQAAAVMQPPAYVKSSL